MGIPDITMSVARKQELIIDPTVISPLATNHFKTQVYRPPSYYNYDLISQVVYKSVATDYQ